MKSLRRYWRNTKLYMWLYDNETFGAVDRLKYWWGEQRVRWWIFKIRIFGIPYREQGYTKETAIRLLACRDALREKDYGEAYHQLYLIASPNCDDVYDGVWKEMEEISGNIGEIKNES